VDRRDRGPVHDFEHGAPRRADAEPAPPECLARRRTQGDDHLRIDEVHLLVEPVPAGEHLGAVRPLVDTALAPRCPLEVLHSVRHVDLAAIDSGGFERVIEHASGRSDERRASLVFLIAWLLADEEQLRPGLTLTKDRLCRPLVQVAPRAGGRLLSDDP
jgi:hypothetical protein